LENKDNSIIQYYSLLQDQIQNEKRIVDSLIDNKQRYTKGILCEDIIKRYLTKLLPSNLKVAQGFIDYNGIKSPQCDIIIYDSANYSPLLSVNDFVLIPYQAVGAIVEVKTKINKREIETTLKNFKTILDLSSINSIRKYMIGFSSINLKNFIDLPSFKPFPIELDMMIVLNEGFVVPGDDKPNILKTENAFLVFVLNLMSNYYFNTGMIGQKVNPYNEYIDKIEVEIVT